MVSAHSTTDPLGILCVSSGTLSIVFGFTDYVTLDKINADAFSFWEEEDRKGRKFGNVYALFDAFKAEKFDRSIYQK